MWLQLELFELAHSHLHPQFSLGCLEASQRNMRWWLVRTESFIPAIAMWPNAWLNIGHGRHHSKPDSSLSKGLYFCHHNISLTVSPTEKFPAEAQWLNSPGACFFPASGNNLLQSLWPLPENPKDHSISKTDVWKQILLSTAENNANSLIWKQLWQMWSPSTERLFPPNTVYHLCTFKMTRDQKGFR